ncbi:MAG: hypothetical protein IPN79_00530 [Saprospiraceae bacterium]|nr:hypothetical protein [Saprospiraceae bacterium]
MDNGSYNGIGGNNQNGIYYTIRENYHIGSYATNGAYSTNGSYSISAAAFHKNNYHEFFNDYEDSDVLYLDPYEFFAVVTGYTHLENAINHFNNGNYIQGPISGYQFINRANYIRKLILPSKSAMKNFSGFLAERRIINR